MVRVVWWGELCGDGEIGVVRVRVENKKQYGVGICV